MTDFITLETSDILDLQVLNASKQSVRTDRSATITEVSVTVIGVSPEISLVQALSTTSIKITFLYPAKDNAALRATQNYLISPALTVSAVTPEAVLNPTYVILTVSEQKQGQSYDVTLQRIVRV